MNINRLITLAKKNDEALTRYNNAWFARRQSRDTSKTPTKDPVSLAMEWRETRKYVFMFFVLSLVIFTIGVFGLQFQIRDGFGLFLIIMCVMIGGAFFFITIAWLIALQCSVPAETMKFMSALSFLENCLLPESRTAETVGQFHKNWYWSDMNYLIEVVVGSLKASGNHVGYLQDVQRKYLWRHDELKDEIAGQREYIKSTVDLLSILLEIPTDFSVYYPEVVETH